MTFIDQGTLGAFRQTWRKGNPRALLKTMIEKNPKVDVQAIYKLFWNEIEDDKEILRDIVGYWLDHNVQSLIATTTPTPTSRPAGNGNSKATATSAAGRLRHRIRYETRIVLLDLVMPNDKPLGECTGAECGRFGGWLFQLSKRVPANAKVAATLSEDEVYKLWLRAKNFKKK